MHFVFSGVDIEGEEEGQVVTRGSVVFLFYRFDVFEGGSWDKEVVELELGVVGGVYLGIVSVWVGEIGRCCSEVKLL